MPHRFLMTRRNRFGGTPKYFAACLVVNLDMSGSHPYSRFQGATQAVGDLRRTSRPEAPGRFQSIAAARLPTSSRMSAAAQWREATAVCGVSSAFAKFFSGSSAGEGSS